MTITDLPRPVLTEPTATPESRNLAALREMLADESERHHWPEIQEAIDYLIGATFARDLAA